MNHIQNNNSSNVSNISKFTQINNIEKRKQHKPHWLHYNRFILCFQQQKSNNEAQVKEWGKLLRSISRIINRNKTIPLSFTVCMLLLLHLFFFYNSILCFSVHILIKTSVKSLLLSWAVTCENFVIAKIKQSLENKNLNLPPPPPLLLGDLPAVIFVLHVHI